MKTCVKGRGAYTNNTLAIANAAMGAMNFYGNVRICVLLYWRML